MMNNPLYKKIASGFFWLGLLAATCIGSLFYILQITQSAETQLRITLAMMAGLLLCALWLGRRFNKLANSLTGKFSDELLNRLLPSLTAADKSADYLRGSATLLTAAAQETKRRSENLPTPDNSNAQTQLIEQAIARATEADITVTRLNATTLQVSTLLTSLADLAEQTKLLALNTGIAANRSKTLAPLADEARQLSERSLQLLQDLATVLTALQNTSPLQQLTSTVKNLKPSQHTDQLLTTVAGITETSENAAYAAQDMLRQSEDISRLAKQTRDEVEAIIQRLQAH